MRVSIKVSEDNYRRESRCVTAGIDFSTVLTVRVLVESRRETSTDMKWSEPKIRVQNANAHTWSDPDGDHR